MSIKQFDPYSKYASSTDISTEFLLEDWNCELVNPRDPALRTIASVDPFSGDIDWAEREQEMFALMEANLGVGLAAPQVGSSYNMFIMCHSVLGNIGCYKPEILEVSDEMANIEEGCLTFPLLYLFIKRPEKVKVRYHKNDGETIVETWMDGMDARCFQHEYDHLQGQIFLEHEDATEFKVRRAKEKRDKYLKKAMRKAKK